MSLKIEYIIPLCQCKQNIFTGHVLAECLFGSKPLPSNNREWRAWYERLPVLVDRAFLEKKANILSINLDTEQILDSHIIESIKKIKNKDKIIIEWTEHAFIENLFDHLESAAIILKELKDKYGFYIAFDDIGSGQDGLQKLSCIKPDLIKIDGNLFKKSQESEHIMNLLRLHVDMYQKYCPVIIEWIETESDLIKARNLGASYGQGYFF